MKSSLSFYKINQNQSFINIHHYPLLLYPFTSIKIHFNHHILFKVIKNHQSKIIKSKINHHQILSVTINQKNQLNKKNPKINYERFNRNNFNIHSWSWNYRGCWHQTCPPIASLQISSFQSPFVKKEKKTKIFIILFKNISFQLFPSFKSSTQKKSTIQKEILVFVFTTSPLCLV